MLPSLISLLNLDMDLNIICAMRHIEEASMKHRFWGWACGVCANALGHSIEHGLEIKNDEGI